MGERGPKFVREALFLFLIRKIYEIMDALIS
jgi:hypothetical protein